MATTAGTLLACGDAARTTGAAGAPPSGGEPSAEAAAGAAALDDDTIRDITALGYLSGYEPAPERSGVTVYERQRAQPGVNLVVSGHAPRAELVGMGGRLFHAWEHAPPADYGVDPKRDFWRRAHLLPDGSLLALLDPYGIVKLDRDSNVVWKTDPALKLHHDLDVAEDGRIYVLGKETRVIPELHPSHPIIDDLIVVLDADGRVLDRFSVYEAFARSRHGEQVLPWVADAARKSAELGNPAHEDFHTNTLQRFDGSQADLSPLFARGNLLLCSPHLNNVFIIDPERRLVVWNWSGPWYRIHEPQLVDDGRFVLFHNNGYQEEGRHSELLEYDLLDRQPTWSYAGEDGDRFFSGTSSTVSRLANGNTLAVVTESGFAFEVTAEGEVVWEYYNPARTGEDDELIASLFQLDRLPTAYVEEWLRELRRERGRARR